MFATKNTVKLACCGALALGTAALAAQQRSISQEGGRGDLAEIRKVSTLIGTHVVNRVKPNNRIADLRDLVLSPDGTVLYSVLGCGGLAGVGETYIVAPFDMLSVRLDDGKWSVVLDMSAEDLKKAPTIKSENYRELSDPQWIARVDQFFRRRGGASQAQPKPGTGLAQPKPGTGLAHREHRTVKWALLATKIRAAGLKNGQNEDLGKVEDLLLDGQHRVVFVIFGTGGVVGIGENHIPVPWSKLRLAFNQENLAVTVVIDAAKVQLEKAPLIKGDDYATLLAPGFAEHVRRYFKVTGRGAEREPR